jgi:riboflavin biosynthesis pyrimidine reductase
MRRIWPVSPVGAPSEPPSDAAAVDEHVTRARPIPEGRPWVMANMVTSLDGAATRAGKSGGLGGAGDRMVFHAVRALPDAILVGAGTVRAERYRPPAVPEGREAAPRLAIVSGQLDLDVDLPCLRDASPDARPWILTGSDAPAERRTLLEPFAEIVEVGPGRVAADAALAVLADAGMSIVLCEGGPSLLGQLAAADLLDEWYVTIAPMVLAGRASRITRADLDADQHLRLDSVLTDGADLLVAYVRASIG